MKNKTYLKVAEVADRYALSVSGVWRMSRQGKMPKPHKLADNAVRWRISDLEAWEKEKEAARG